MTLIRRQKRDMTPQPNGVVPRVQLSPYRLQLAGIRTSPVEYLRLEHEVVVAGFLTSESDSTRASPLSLNADVFERNAALLSVGQEGAVTCDARPDEPFKARIVDILPAAVPSAGKRVRMLVENPRGELRPGPYASAKFRTPAARLDTQRRAELDRWRDRAIVSATFASFGRIADPPPIEWPLFALVDAGMRQAAAREGLVVCVPESAVIDTGTRRVVYVESMPGVFDAVEVRLGRRCGDHYPVHAGLEPGQLVATTGAVLLDAETRLNPNVAATYFGSGSRTPAASPQTNPAPSSTSDDRQLIARQKICPVSGGDLGSMGGPVKVVVDGRVVFICCKECESSLRKEPGQYLMKLPQ